jgi:parallel beta-helix repeat protein
VAGIAAGLNGSFGSETFSGMARGANIIAIKIFSQINDAATCNGFGRPAPCALVYNTDQVSGLQQVAILASSFNIAAANMSLGGGKYTTQASCDAANGSKKAAIDALRTVNIATVIASGNNGYTDGISGPGCISTAVSVGATNFSDGVASFSNSASFLSLLAPGVGVLSSIEGGSYDYWDGTSMATPQVAGAWAILKQRMPGATVTQLLTALQNTGVPVLDTRNGITKPRIQVDAALNSLGPITVTNTADSGTSSLRAALTFANAQNSLTTINFNITGAGVKTISPVSTLPTLTKPVVIDGYTQPGAVAATSSIPATLLIALDGASAGTTSGLTLTGGNSTVRGLVIDHFAQNGITLTTNGSNIISGNYIGVNAAGTTAAANSGNGIAVLSGANNTIGGTTADAPNIVAYNSAVGVAVTGTSGNNILTNRIFSNTGLGIDLLSGANGNQAAPVLASALTNGSSTLTVNGTLNSTASTTFRLEFFSNTSCDSSGAGEGETYLGTTNVTTNGSGSASFNTGLSGAVAWGKSITATASGTNGTSEFSTCVTALSAVTQTAPIGTITSRNPTFTWQSVLQATQYKVWVGTSGGATLLNQAYSSAVCSGGTCSITPTLDLSSGYYAWWIVPNGPAGDGLATGQGFTVAIMPGAITQTAPIGTVSTRNPAFTWQADRDATWYGVWVGKSDGTTLINPAYIASAVCSGTTCSVTPTLALSSGYYAWWIVANGIAGKGPATGQGFTVSILPGSVVQTAPIGNITSPNPTFTWQADRDAAGYSLWIGTSGGATLLSQAYSAGTVCTGTTCSIAPTLNLAPGNYAWWITAYGIAGSGPSTGKAFTVTP